MAKCKNCKHLKIDSSIEKKICFLIGEIGNPDEEISCACYRPATNADRIRNMTIEELAEILCEFHVCVLCEHQDDGVCLVSECKEIEITKRWLKSEVGGIV